MTDPLELLLFSPLARSAVVNDMGAMCRANNPVIPAGFDVTSGDAFVAMCNEGVRGGVGLFRARLQLRLPCSLTVVAHTALRCRPHSRHSHTHLPPSVVYYKNTFNVNGKLFTTGEKPSDYLTAWQGNQTLPWLTKVATAAAAGGPPFFAYLGPHAPHFPAEPAPWYVDAPLPSQVAPRVPSYNAFTQGKSWAIQTNPAFNNFTAAGIDLHFRNRQRTLLSIDDHVRDIFAALEAAGVLDNTYVFVTSDHGCAYRWAALHHRVHG